MTQDISFVIDMNIENDLTMGELEQLPLEERQKKEHEIAQEVFFELVKERSIQAIDILTGLGTNDYEQGHSKIEIPLGIAWGCIHALKDVMEKQARTELQVQTERTEYGAKLANESSDLISAIHGGMAELIQSQCEYFSLLYNRRMNRHLLDSEGKTTPYTDEELLRQQLMASEAEQ